MNYRYRFWFDLFESLFDNVLVGSGKDTDITMEGIGHYSLKYDTENNLVTWKITNKNNDTIVLKYYRRNLEYTITLEHHKRGLISNSEFNNPAEEDILTALKELYIVFVTILDTCWFE